VFPFAISSLLTGVWVWSIKINKNLVVENYQLFWMREHR
jgi:hypothetical protein